jgi:hypothetical protein
VTFNLQVQKGIPINILAFIPAVILGIIGGFLGALYTFMNLKIVKARRRFLASIRRKWKRNVVKIGEPMLLMVCYEWPVDQVWSLEMVTFDLRIPEWNSVMKFLLSVSLHS